MQHQLRAGEMINKLIEEKNFIKIKLFVKIPHQKKKPKMYLSWTSSLLVPPNETVFQLLHSLKAHHYIPNNPHNFTYVGGKIVQAGIKHDT